MLKKAEQATIKNLNHHAKFFLVEQKIRSGPDMCVVVAIGKNTL